MFDSLLEDNFSTARKANTTVPISASVYYSGGGGACGMGMDVA